jgi:hypothetical protein
MQRHHLLLPTSKLQKHNAALTQADWYRYIDSETMLGTAWT